MPRDTWATRIGFILAAMGSAVGLGNIWRFPWMVASNGGSAFLVTYLFVTFVAGVPGLLAALVVGRRANRNPVGAFRQLSHGSRAWWLFSLLFIVTSIVLLSFYGVVGGWSINYFVASFTGAYASDPSAYFSSVSFGPTALLYQVVFLVLTAAIVGFGVRRGIEAGTKIMMPVLTLLLVGIGAWAVTQPGAVEGYTYLLQFDVSTLTQNFTTILPAAVGQSVFTLSIGSGTMITYASYIGEDRSLPFDGATIAVLNTLIGVLAGLVVFPLLFALQGSPGSGGPGTLFASLASGFASLPYGNVLGVAFFAVIVLAALSSAISILEIPIAFLVDEYDFERRQVTFGLLSLILLTGATNSLSNSLFTFFSGPLVSILMTAGLIGVLLLTGWVLRDEAIEEVILGGGTIATTLAKPWLALVSMVLPLFLGYSLLQAVLGVLSVNVPSLVAVLAVLVLGAAVFSALYWRYPNGIADRSESYDQPSGD